MSPSFQPARAWTLFILFFACTVLASHAPAPYKRSRYRHLISRAGNATFDTRSLAERAAPSGWSIYTKSGNDGGGCYIDSSAARVLKGYTVTDSKNGLQSCLTTCKDKGFLYAGLQYSTQCYVSPFTSLMAH